MDDFSRIIEFVVIGVYLVFLLGIGLAFRRFNSNISDFFRNGARGTWWLVGTSSFMAGISAYTFTGASGVAYKAGWSVAIIYLANAAGYFVNFLFLAPWFRQLRAITAPEVIRLRFGPGTQQFYALFGVLTSLLYSGLQLWALAIFSSAVFGFQVWQVIVVIGLVVLFYSTTGGSWAVMATDFVQSLVMIPMTILITVLCLMEVGGFNGLFRLIEQAGLSTDYSIINSPGDFPVMQFTLVWAAAMFLKQVVEHNTLLSAQRYFSVKDGREARKAAFLAFCLMTLGCSFWFIPPMVSRLLFEADVATMGAMLNDPTEAAFAVASMKLLPLGLTGMIVVAMFAATMSSMDSGLNRNAAIFVRDIYPAICRLLGKKSLGDTGLLLLGRCFSIMFGFAIIGMSIYFATVGGSGMFDTMLKVGAMLGLPLAVPLLMGLFIRRAPAWAGIASVLCALAPAITADINGWAWNFQTMVLANMSAGVAAFLATMPFWGTASEEYQKQVDDFFERMHRPVDFEKEVGGSNDTSQLTLIGAFTLAVGGFILLLLLLPNAWQGRLSILFVASIVITVGTVMFAVGRRARRRTERLAAASASSGKAK
jgi:solute:Na+ symporter, SSS family